MRLEILEEDWDEAVSRVEEYQFNDPDFVCENCVAAGEFLEPSWGETAPKPTAAVCDRCQTAFQVTPDMVIGLATRRSK